MIKSHELGANNHIILLSRGWDALWLADVDYKWLLKSN